MAAWSTCLAAMALLAVGTAAAPTDCGTCPELPNALHAVGADGGVAVECEDEADGAVLCRPASETQRAGRRFLGRIGFLTGLHLGGAIHSSGSLSASHSLNVFGKVMNTALSVSYGPNGYYQGPGSLGGRPPLNPVAPAFGGLADDPNTASSTSSSFSVSSAASSSPDKGGEASAVVAGTLSRGAALAKVSAEAPASLGGPGGHGRVEQNRLPVPEDIVAAEPNRSGDKNREGAEPAPVNEVVDEESNEVGEEPIPEPPAAPVGVQLSSQRRAQLEAVARVRTPSTDEQRRLFVQHHNQHVAAFNRHHAKYNGDVSRVAVLSRN